MNVESTTSSRSAPTDDAPSHVRLLAFAAVRDVLGAAELDLDLRGAKTAQELWPVLLDRFPSLAVHRGSIRLAINGTYAFPEDAVRAGDEVALIPPVAGG